MVRVHLDSGDYSKLDSEMRHRGYFTTILALVDDEPISVQLPTGQYWKGEPTDEIAMRDEALEAVRQMGELGAQIVATAGLSAWEGLVPVGPGITPSGSERS